MVKSWQTPFRPRTIEAWSCRTARTHGNGHVGISVSLPFSSTVHSSPRPMRISVVVLGSLSFSGHQDYQLGDHLIQLLSSLFTAPDILIRAPVLPPAPAVGPKLLLPFLPSHPLPKLFQLSYGQAEEFWLTFSPLCPVAKPKSLASLFCPPDPPPFTSALPTGVQDSSASTKYSTR